MPREKVKYDDEDDEDITDLGGDEEELEDVEEEDEEEETEETGEEYQRGYQDAYKRLQGLIGFSDSEVEEAEKVYIPDEVLEDLEKDTKNSEGAWRQRYAEGRVPFESLPPAVQRKLER